jgi:putative sterol carrier protein
MSDLTPEKFFEQMKEKIASNPDLVQKLNTVYQFKLNGPNGGDWYVDLTKPGGEIGKGTNPAAKCTITMNDADFISLVQGKLNSQMAFMTGKLKIQGDMGLALKLQNLLK